MNLSNSPKATSLAISLENRLKLLITGGAVRTGKFKGCFSDERKIVNAVGENFFKYVQTTRSTQEEVISSVLDNYCQVDESSAEGVVAEGFVRVSEETVL